MSNSGLNVLVNQGEVLAVHVRFAGKPYKAVNIFSLHIGQFCFCIGHIYQYVISQGVICFVISAKLTNLSVFLNKNPHSLAIPLQQ